MSPFRFSVLLFCLLTASSHAMSYRLIRQSGHDGPFTDLAWHGTSGTLISTGEDGRLIVIQPEDGRILHRFRVAGGRITEFSPHPLDERVAIAHNSKKNPTLDVWDWNAEKLLYSHELSGDLLFLTWSAKGRYLVYGELAMPSVTVLNGRTGKKLPFLRELPALYEAGYIGSTENNLMTYTGNGLLEYWDIKKTTRQASVRTLPNLKELTVLPSESRRRMIAVKDNSLFLIDRLTGAVLDELRFPDIQDHSVDASNGEIDVLTSGGASSGYTIYGWRVENGDFVPRGREEQLVLADADDDDGTQNPGKRFRETNTASKILRKIGSTFLADDAGVLYREREGLFEPLIVDHSWKPDGMAFDENFLYLSSGAKILRFESRFFAEKSRGDIRHLKNLEKKEITLKETDFRSGLSVLSNGHLVLWDKEDPLSPYRILDFDNPHSITSGKIGATDIKVLEDGRLFLVDRTDGVRIVEPKSGKSDLHYRSFGILDAGYLDSEDMIITSSTASTGSPLKMVNEESKESVPLFDDRLLVYAVASGKSKFYTLGVEKTPHFVRTILLQHSNAFPNRTRLIHSVSGETLDAVLLSHPYKDGVFTTLGNSPVFFGTHSTIDFPAQGRIEHLTLRGNVLYGLDKDGVIHFWNASTGKYLLTIDIFVDGSWIALSAEKDKLWFDLGALEHVILYKDNRLLTNETL